MAFGVLELQLSPNCCCRIQTFAAENADNGYRLFRRLFLAGLVDAHAAGRLAFFDQLEGLRRREAFAAHLAPLRRKKWFLYAKPPPCADPEAVLAYLARYTHRVAISNSRL